MSYRGVFLVTHSYLLAWLAAAIVLGVAGLTFRFRTNLLNVVSRLCPSGWIESAAWFWCFVLIGVMLRITWVLLFPVHLKLDGIAYYDVAVSLAEHHYTGAFWPPGLPLFLAPLMTVFGTSAKVTVLGALLLFVATSGMVWLLARALAGRRAAGIASAVLALWPGYLTVSGINSKEGLIAFLLTAAMLLYLRSFESSRRWMLVVSAGVLTGLATLTQPGCILFPAVIAVSELIRLRTFSTALVRTSVFGMAMLLAIFPWTYRNLRVVHRPILISANGGSVFYRANNPLANASYQEAGAINLPDDVYEADRLGYREGAKWVIHHPGAFLALAVRKQVVYLGDDGVGVYETLKRGLRPSNALYGAFKGICSVYWLAVWLALFSGFPRMLARPRWWLWYSVCFLPVCYQWFIDSIFESGSRHHLSDVGLLAILVGIALTSSQVERNESGAGAMCL